MGIEVEADGALGACVVSIVFAVAAADVVDPVETATSETALVIAGAGEGAGVEAGSIVDAAETCRKAVEAATSIDGSCCCVCASLVVAASDAIVVVGGA